jgi:hypothetical protein
MDYRQTVNHLLAAAMEVSPTGTEQSAFGRLVNNMRNAGEDDKSVSIELAATILEGLRNGNWPDPADIVA